MYVSISVIAAHNILKYKHSFWEYWERVCKTREFWTGSPRTTVVQLSTSGVLIGISDTKKHSKQSHQVRNTYIWFPRQVLNFDDKNMMLKSRASQYTGILEAGVECPTN